jgi:hypothetical protein
MVRRCMEHTQGLNWICTRQGGECGVSAPAFLSPHESHGGLYSTATGWGRLGLGSGTSQRVLPDAWCSGRSGCVFGGVD